MNLMERKILWEKTSEDNPERHTYRILICNEPREINRVSQRLNEYLQPVIERRTLGDGSVGTLRYLFVELETPVNVEEFSQVYRGKIRRDRRLEKRKTSQGESNLIEMISAGEI